jgi:hypothetical protein
MRNDVTNIINHVFETAETWEEQPAKEIIEKAIIEFARKMFYDGAIYGYGHGLNKDSINVEKEMNERLLVITKKQVTDGRDTAT